MNPTADAVLAHECAVFCRYLVAQSPTAYVVEVYGDAHRRVARLQEAAPGSFDRWLTQTASKHPMLTKLADAYTAVFFRRALIREKWVLLLAILETSPPTSACFDLAHPTGRWVLAARMIQRGVVFTAFVVLSAALLWPVRLFFAVRSRLGRRSS